MISSIKLSALILTLPYLLGAQVFNTSAPNSSDVMSRSVRADNLVKAGQYEQALSVYDNILESSPDYVDG
jgi:pentatricopeptide repeat protein